MLSANYTLLYFVVLVRTVIRALALEIGTFPFRSATIREKIGRPAIVTGTDVFLIK